jgi:hypothetical protein
MKDVRFTNESTVEHRPQGKERHEKKAVHAAINGGLTMHEPKVDGDIKQSLEVDKVDAWWGAAY